MTIDEIEEYVVELIITDALCIKLIAQIKDDVNESFNEKGVLEQYNVESE